MIISILYITCPIWLLRCWWSWASVQDWLTSFKMYSSGSELSRLCGWASSRRRRLYGLTFYRYYCWDIYLRHTHGINGLTRLQSCWQLCTLICIRTIKVFTCVFFPLAVSISLIWFCLSKKNAKLCYVVLGIISLIVLLFFPISNALIKNFYPIYHN